MILILNDVAGSEILLILVFVLIFFGSKSIPSLAKTMGRTIRQVKEASSEIQNEIKKSGAEMKKDLNLKGLFEETAQDIRRPLDQMASDIDNAVKYEPKKVVVPKPEVAEKLPNETVSTVDADTQKISPELKDSPDTSVDSSKEPI